MPIVLDRDDEFRRIVEMGGGKYLRSTAAFAQGSELIWFTDLVTRTTLVLPVEQLSEGTVRHKIVESRKNFRETVNSES